MKCRSDYALRFQECDLNPQLSEPQLIAVGILLQICHCCFTNCPLNRIIHIILYNIRAKSSRETKGDFRLSILEHRGDGCLRSAPQGIPSDQRFKLFILEDCGLEIGPRSPSFTVRLQSEEYTVITKMFPTASSKISSFLMALLKRLIDDDDLIRQEISHTIYRLGQQWPEYILLTCRYYLRQRVSLPDDQMTIILNTMEMIVKDNLSLITPSVAESLITSASMRMTTLIEAHQQSREAACNLMVTIGLRYLDEVLAVTLEDMKKGYPSHVYMVKALIRLSTVHVHGMVPFMKSILEIMIPVMMEVTSDYNKSVSAAALGAFSKNILLYEDNVETQPQPTVTIESFANEMNTAFDLLFNKWLEKEESPINIVIVEALGYTTALMPKDSLEIELPRLIPGILALYRIQSEHLAITRSLSHIIVTAISIRSQSLRTQMEALLSNLHEELCVPVDCDKWLVAENHNQILGCFTVLAQDHVNSLMEFLLPQLETNNPQNRQGTLTVLKHLIRVVPSQLESRKVQIVAGLKSALRGNNNNDNIKKLIVETIGAMAYEGFLDLEGGRTMVQFIIEQHVLSTDSRNRIPLDNDVDLVTHEDLSAQCETMLFTLTALESMEDILWPFLLQFMTLTQYSKGLKILSHCLIQLAKKKLQSGDENYFLIYKEKGNLPRPQALLTRLLLIACFPHEGEGRGSAVLRLLQVMSCNIHPATVKVWEEKIPLLVQDLMQSSEKSLPQQEWEEKLILFLSESLEAIDDERWTCQLRDDINQQITISHSYPQQKGFLFKCLGMVLQHTKSTDMKKEIQQMLQSAQHEETFEREGVAVGIGFCSITHFEATFSRLVDYSHLNLLQKTRSFLHIQNEESDLRVDNAQSTMVLCFGYLALNAPPDLVLPRIEDHIFPFLRDQLCQLGQRLKEESQDLTLTLSLIKSVTLMARAMQSSSHTVPLNFSRKRELLKYMQQLIGAEPTGLLQIPIQLSAMNACLHLLQVNPRLTEAENCQLLDICLRSIFTLVPVVSSQDQDGTPVTPEGGETLHSESMAALHRLLKQVLLQNLSPQGFQSVYKLVDHWVTSPSDCERERAVDTTLKLLAFYWQELNAESHQTVDNPVKKWKISPRDCERETTVDTTLELLKCYLQALNTGNIIAPIVSGSVVGRLLPRCADPVLAVRQGAMDSLHILLKFQACYQGLSGEEQNEQGEILKTIGQRLASTDSSVLFQGCSELAQLISKHLPQDQLGNLLLTLFQGLVDHHPICSNIAAVIMRSIVERRGPELQDHLSETLEALHQQMQTITQEQVRFIVVDTFTLLTSQQLPAVVRCLLRFPGPVDEGTKSIWRLIAKKTQLTIPTLKQLIQEMNTSVPLNERSHSVAEDDSPDPLAVITAVYEIVSQLESAEAVNTLYSGLFSALLVHLSPCICELRQTENQLQTPSCESQDQYLSSVETLKTMLNRAQNEPIVISIQEKGGWDLMQEPNTYNKGIALLAEAMGLFSQHQLLEIVMDLAPFLSTTQEGQGVTVAAFFTELSKCSFISNVDLTNILVNHLIRCLFHSSLAIRVLCARGLGNIPIGVMERHSADLLTTMTTILQSEEYHEEVFMIEVTSTLSKLLDQLGVNVVGPFCTAIAKGIRRFFEGKSAQVRAAAFTVFGSLAKCGYEPLRASFKEEIHLNLVSLLLHLDEESEDVCRACFSTLCSIAPFMDSQKVSAIIQEFSWEGSLKYEGFLNIFSSQLIKDFPRRIDSYIKCCMSFQEMVPRLRGNAAFLSAVLTQKTSRRRTWIEKLCCLRISR
ncbi:maestro heat-like repeat-containing protein family member 1 [Heterodontus francisci]|uniref:maestro heat-like repeat-containing protein family member 1 n=1 Tax=Heterodontus francisci TaxID=7792 RepID=UPI00355BA67D